MSLFLSYIRNQITNCPRRTKIYNQISPILTDISLSTGISSHSPVQFPTKVKLSILNRIISQQNPRNIEVGVLANSTNPTIFSDSIDIYKYANRKIYNNIDKIPNPTSIYMSIPSGFACKLAIDSNITHLSVNTSISSSFQEHYTMRTMTKNKMVLAKIDKLLLESGKNTTIKLYISCVNHCPILGKIDPYAAFCEIAYYHINHNYDEICITDTMGNMNPKDYEKIVRFLHLYGVPMSKISLHLRVSNTNIGNIRQILWHSFSMGINKFDVCLSELSSENMSYELFNQILYEYIDM